MSSPTEEVVADQSLEEWTFLEEEDAVAGEEDEHQNPTHGIDRQHDAASAASSVHSSDIEVIEHDSDEETILNESTTSLHQGQRYARIFDHGMDWSFADGGGALDLSPGTKAYTHHPNDSVNFWLNLSVLVAVTAVAGMGIGNYVGTYVNWPRNSLETPYQTLHLKHLQKQLDDCLHEKDLLLNTTHLHDMDSGLGLIPITSTLTIGPQNKQQHQENHPHPEDRVIESPASPPPIISTPRENRIPNSEVRVPGQQMIVRKSSAIKIKTVTDKAEPPSRASVVTVTDSEKSIVIQTSTIISFRTKDSSKRRNHPDVLESEVEIMLLLTHKGPSQPVFLNPERRSDNKKIIGSLFKPFLAKAFRGQDYTVWIDEEEERTVVREWNGVNVKLPERKSPHWHAVRKMTKFFWSNLKKKVFKGWKGQHVSEFKTRLTEVLKSLPESHFVRMFEKMDHKARRGVAKMQSIRSKG